MVTVALGSTLATVLLSSSVALAEGVLALALLADLQYVVAWASARSKRVERVVKSEPRLVYRNGLLPQAMRQERVTADELYQDRSTTRHADLSQVAAVVLETDGKLTVLTNMPSSLQPPPGGEAHGMESEGQP